MPALRLSGTNRRGAPAKNAKARTCPSRKALLSSPKDRVEELVTAVAEGHEEGVETPLTLLFRVVPTASLKEVDLRLLAWR